MKTSNDLFVLWKTLGKIKFPDIGKLQKKDKY